MKSDLRRWRKEKKRKEELLKSKHTQSQLRNEITEPEKVAGINHIIVMVVMVIMVLGFIFYRMR
jgi:hypothetical protein